MSLINQMLKDLEQRGVGDSNMMTAYTDKPAETQLHAASKLQTAKASKAALSLIKIGSLLVLFAGGVYLWINNGSALFHNTEVLKTDIARLKPQAKVSIATTATTHKIEAPMITTLPAVEKRAIENPITIESHPLLELNLKYKQIATQSPPIKVDTNNTRQKPVTLQPQQIAEPTKLIASEKSTLVEYVKSKPITKPNVNDTTIGKQIRPSQKSDNLYRHAITNLEQGRVSEAVASLTQALEINPANQEARLSLAGLLVDNKRNNEAKATLVAGLESIPEQSDFRMALARLQLEAGDHSGALNSLEQGLAYANGNATYQSFLATLLQRTERHEEAINHYMTALSLNDTNPNSLVGLGISLQAVGKLERAEEAFTRAQTSAKLTSELALFVDQRLKQINQLLHR